MHQRVAQLGQRQMTAKAEEGRAPEASPSHPLHRRGQFPHPHSPGTCTSSICFGNSPLSLLNTAVSQTAVHEGDTSVLFL